MDKRLVTPQEVERGMHTGLTQMKSLLQQWQPDAIVVLLRSGVLAYQSVWGALDVHPRVFGELSELARSPILANIGRESVGNWRLEEGDAALYNIAFAMELRQGKSYPQLSDAEIERLTDIYQDFRSFLLARKGVQREVQHLKREFTKLELHTRHRHHDSIRILVIDETYYQGTTLKATAPVIVEEAVVQLLREQGVDFQGTIDIRGHLLLAEEDHEVDLLGWLQSFIDDVGRDFNTDVLWDRLTDDVVKQIILAEVPQEELELPLKDEDVDVFRTYYQDPMFNLFVLYVDEVVRGFFDDEEEEGDYTLTPLDTIDAVKRLAQRYHDKGTGVFVEEHNPELNPLQDIAIIMGWNVDEMAQRLLDLRAKIVRRLRKMGEDWAREIESGEKSA